MITSQYHAEWQQYRLEFILQKYSEDFFKGKRILELGPLNGFFGAKFESYGAEVTCLEGRQENVDKIRSEFPQLTVKQYNLDTPLWEHGKWDIIINFGLLYHLSSFQKEHLVNCIANCDLMFLESVIYDSDDAEIFFRRESGFDQSLSGLGGTPSTAFIENIFEECKIEKYTKYCDEFLNANAHSYSWPDKNSKVFNEYMRRFWIVKP